MKKKEIIIGGDGTFNNINSENKKDKLEMALNMGYYDVTNDILLFNSKLTVDEFKKLTRTYIIYNFIELGLYKGRKAKTPFFKWYVKGHSNHSLLCKLVYCFLNNDKSNLHNKP